MRIAITYEKDTGNIYQHFGSCECFKVYEIRDRKVLLTYGLEPTETGHEELADFLAENQVDAVLCGGIGGDALVALNNRGILLFGGVQGTADGAIDLLLNDKLVYKGEASCNQHCEGCSHCDGEEDCESCDGCEDEVFANEIYYNEH